MTDASISSWVPGADLPILPALPPRGAGRVSAGSSGPVGGSDVRRTQGEFHAPVTAYLGRVSPGTRPALESGLRVLAGLLNREPAELVHVTRPQALWLRARLAERHTPAYVNKLLVYLRGLLREAVALGQLDRDACERVCYALGVRGSRQAPGRALEPSEVSQLMEGAGLQDRAAIALMVGAGLRGQEVCGLAWRNWRRDVHELLVRGKGDVERVVPLSRRVERRCLDWWRVCESVHVSTRQIRGLRAALERRRVMAGVAAFTLHDLRRTFVSRMLEVVDLASVQALVGHADPRTTSGYDRRPAAARAVAVGELQVGL